VAASVPAVAYAAGATQQMIEHGREGLIAPIGDKQCLAAYLSLLIDNGPMRHGMAMARPSGELLGRCGFVAQMQC